MSHHPFLLSLELLSFTCNSICHTFSIPHMSDISVISLGKKKGALWESKFHSTVFFMPGTWSGIPLTKGMHSKSSGMKRLRIGKYLWLIMKSKSFILSVYLRNISFIILLLFNSSSLSPVFGKVVLHIQIHRWMVCSLCLSALTVCLLVAAWYQVVCFAFKYAIFLKNVVVVLRRLILYYAGHIYFSSSCFCKVGNFHLIIYNIRSFSGNVRRKNWSDVRESGLVCTWSLHLEEFVIIERQRERRLASGVEMKERNIEIQKENPPGHVISVLLTKRSSLLLSLKGTKLINTFGKGNGKTASEMTFLWMSPSVSSYFHRGLTLLTCHSLLNANKRKRWRRHEHRLLWDLLTRCLFLSRRVFKHRQAITFFHFPRLSPFFV